MTNNPVVLLLAEFQLYRGELGLIVAIVQLMISVTQHCLIIALFIALSCIGFDIDAFVATGRLPGA